MSILQYRQGHRPLYPKNRDRIQQSPPIFQNVEKVDDHNNDEYKSRDNCLFTIVIFLMTYVVNFYSADDLRNNKMRRM